MADRIVMGTLSITTMKVSIKLKGSKAEFIYMVRGKTVERERFPIQQEAQHDGTIKVGRRNSSLSINFETTHFHNHAITIKFQLTC